MFPDETTAFRNVSRWKTAACQDEFAEGSFCGAQLQEGTDQSEFLSAHRGTLSCTSTGILLWLTSVFLFQFCGFLLIACQ